MIVFGEDQRFIGQAVNVAKGADRVVLAVGTDLTMGQEGVSVATCMRSDGRFSF